MPLRYVIWLISFCTLSLTACDPDTLCLTYASTVTNKVWLVHRHTKEVYFSKLCGLQDLRDLKKSLQEAKNALQEAQASEAKDCSSPSWRTCPGYHLFPSFCAYFREDPRVLRCRVQPPHGQDKAAGRTGSGSTKKRKVITKSI